MDEDIPAFVFYLVIFAFTFFIISTHVNAETYYIHPDQPKIYRNTFVKKCKLLFFCKTEKIIKYYDLTNSEHRRQLIDKGYTLDISED